MKLSKRLITLLVLAIAGFGISAYQTSHFYQVRTGMAGFDAFCKFGAFDCIAVESSPYAEFLFGLPVSGFATGWYLALALITLMAGFANWRREAVRAASVMTAFGTLMSLVYLYIMAEVMGTYCLLCLVIDGINIGALGISLSLKPQGLISKPNLKQWKSLALVTAGSLAVTLIWSKMLDTPPAESRQFAEIVDEILASPTIQIDVPADSPSIGPADAPITIIKFSDMQCPSCQRGAFAIHPVLERYKGKVRFVLRNFPLDQACNRIITRPMHPVACESAKAVLCAHTQGKFSEVYETLFQHQSEIKTVQNIVEKASAAGVNRDQLVDCMKDPKTSAKIGADIEDAIRMHIESTPTFFINGKKVVGGLPPSAWNEIVDALLKKK